MSELKYYRISCSEDGDVRVHAYMKKDLEGELARRAAAADDGEPTPMFVPEIPGADPQYWDGKSVLIKGEIVVPKSRVVVKTWELP